MAHVLAVFGVTAIFAALAYLLGMVSRGGALGGFVVGALIYASLGPQGFAILALFVLGGSPLTPPWYGPQPHLGTAPAGDGARAGKKALADRAGAASPGFPFPPTSLDTFAAAFVP